MYIEQGGSKEEQGGSSASSFKGNLLKLLPVNVERAKAAEEAVS